MIVAVAFSLPPDPPQHSPMFGHLASSQTVAKPKALTSFLILLNSVPVGMLVFKCEGNRL